MKSSREKDHSDVYAWMDIPEFFVNRFVIDHAKMLDNVLLKMVFPDVFVQKV